MARSVDLVRQRGQPMLLLESPPAVPLDHVIDGPTDLGRFQPIAVAVSAAVSASIMKLLAETPEGAASDRRGR